MIKFFLLIIVCISFVSCSNNFNNEIIYEGKSISGYFGKRSYFSGDSAFLYYSDCEAKKIYDTLFLNNPSSVYKLKYYIHNVNGQVIDSVFLPPTCKNDISPKAWENGFGYDSVKIKIPELESGIYLINNKIPFIVRNALQSDIAVIYPTNTINAYNTSGGKNLYRSFLPEDSLSQVDNRAHIVSFLRPLENPMQQYAEEFFKWVKNEPYTMDYISDEDLENYSNLKNKKLLIITGHNEYWTRNARENVDKFVDSGGNLLILSGNVMWWQVRVDSINNKMICYKSTQLDIVDNPLLITTRWEEKILEYEIISSTGADFSYGGYGKSDKDKGWDGYKVIKPNSPIFKNTKLTYGDVFSLPTEEYDGSPIVGYNKLNEPIINNDKLKFYKIELLAYDFGFRFDNTVGTFIAFQKTANSGIVINTASTNWCSNTGIGGKDSTLVRNITKNMIELLKDSESKVFSDN